MKAAAMSRCGDVYENRITGEYAVILRGTEDRGDGPAIVHLTAKPGAAVVGEHFHPHMTERFTVLSGRLDCRIAGRPFTLGPGQSTSVAAGVAHDWWNGSATEAAQVILEIDRAPGAGGVDANRFEMLIGMLFGLANDGKTDRKGRPFPLQGAVIAREFADVIVFTKPPPPVQRVLLGILAPVAIWLGYRATDAAYCKPQAHIDPAPDVLSSAGLRETT